MLHVAHETCIGQFDGSVAGMWQSCLRSLSPPIITPAREAGAVKLLADTISKAQNFERELRVSPAHAANHPEIAL